LIEIAEAATYYLFGLHHAQVSPGLVVKHLMEHRECGSVPVVRCASHRSVCILLALALVLTTGAGADETAYIRPVLVKVLLKGKMAASKVTIDGVLAVRHPLWAPDYSVVEFRDERSADAGLRVLRAMPEVGSARLLSTAARVTRDFEMNDPLATFDPTERGYQWHLGNTGENGATIGIDLNVATAWNTFRGAGVAVAILDDAVQISHPDIAPNAGNSLHFDWLDGNAPLDPEGTSLDEHGTACAGLAAGRGGNGIGTSGVAPEASLVGLRMLGNTIDDEVEGAALAHEEQAIHIKSSSWGPSDRTTEPDGPAELAIAALEHGARTGRGGLGTLYVWAAGNGRDDGDLSNLDGYANSIYTIAVGAVTDMGKITDYGELGANVLISAPSAGGGQEITTTDLVGIPGKNSGFSAGNYSNPDYRNDFGGTSAAAPEIAGALALMLEANPGLSWRDVQEILLRSGRRVDFSAAGWLENGAGFQFHPALGAGLLDVTAAVVLAENWTSLPAQENVIIAVSGLSLAVPDGESTGVAVPVTFPEQTGDLRVEHVTVDVVVRHASKNQVQINLVSPAGTVSPLAIPHTARGSDPNRDIDWRFMTVFHWGEPLAGDWQLVFADTVPGVTGTIESYTVTAYGSRSPRNPSTYPEWAAIHFSQSQESDPAADPDHDGCANLLEYAQGSDPLEVDKQRQQEPLEFRRNSALEDINWTVEYSSDLDAWIPAQSTLLRTDIDGIEVRRATSPEGENASGYFRLRVELRP
jgi:subtilisin-like proprotein convertase family protein